MKKFPWSKIQTDMSGNVVAVEPKKKRACALKHPVRFGRHLIHLTDEGLEQFTVCRWLEAHGIFFCAIPNGGKKTAFERLMGTALGEKAGAADLVIFDTPPGIDGYKCVAIEMKAKSGGKLSDRQREWMERAGKSMIYYKCCFGADEAIAFLTAAGYGGRK